MRRGTTPELALTIADVDLTAATVFVTIRQGHKRMTKTGSELAVSYADGATAIAVALTQQETLELKQGSAEVQVRYIDPDGYAGATDCAPIGVEDVLLEGVIEHADTP